MRPSPPFDSPPSNLDKNILCSRLINSRKYYAHFDTVRRVHYQIAFHSESMHRIHTSKTPLCGSILCLRAAFSKCQMSIITHPFSASAARYFTSSLVIWLPPPTPPPPSTNFFTRALYLFTFVTAIIFWVQSVLRRHINSMCVCMFASYVLYAYNTRGIFPLNKQTN